MMEHERQSDDGWEKFLYRVYMILTFPVRRWWIILSVLATVLLVLIIIPTLDGVKKEDIVDWYKAKLVHSDLNKAKNKTIAMISKKVDNLTDNVKQILPNSPEESKEQTKPAKKESNLVSWNVAEFKKAKYVPSKEKKGTADKKESDTNIFAKMKNIATQSTEKPIKQIKPITTAKIKAENPLKSITSYYNVRTDLNLEYLDKPEVISGSATISGANELYIEETFVYLYGIYTNPRKYSLSQAKSFLENITENQTVTCSIVAYSTQTQAKTALCFVDGALINKQMVLEKMADNVALKME